jgi:telomere length regulation protein
LTNSTDRIQRVLEVSMQQFGDKLYIKHTPILNQEVNAQVMLLAAGCVHRGWPMFLFTLAKSSTHLSGVSNRLSSTSTRSRYLGMIVGESISALVDKAETKMNWHMDEMNSDEARWYKSLTGVEDHPTEVLDIPLHEIMSIGKAPTTHSSSYRAKSAKPRPREGQSSKIISIEEIEDEDEQEDEEDDDDLIPYGQPDSDAEDSEEDPTLISRNKPTAPVYLRDLISYFRDTDNYDKQKLALQTASPLVRRKASFGTEVADYAEQLATLLTGLQDKFDIPQFQEQKIQAMIALVVALPMRMGLWFSKSLFDGDYSIGQRATMLTALGMGARELAGLKDEDSHLTGAEKFADGSFPTKMLPAQLHRAFSGSIQPYNRQISSEMDTIARRLEKTMIQPMAVEAAEKETGPTALKTRTFSSRMEVEKKRKKPIANDLAKVVAEGFFFPLTGRWWAAQKGYQQNIHASPSLLPTFLTTLSLLLHASGPSTLALPQLTSEYWSLLLSLTRSASLAAEPAVLEALLFGFLTILEVNGNNAQRLASEQGRELLETREWVGVVFEGMGGSGSLVAQGAKRSNGEGKDERMRMLAAGVLVRCSGVVEAHERLLVGELLDY